MPRVINDGISIHYRVEGKGLTLVLEHGFSDSSETWYELGYVEALRAKYRLILIDARGHGQSDKPHDPPSYAPENFATDIVAVLDDLSVRVAAYWGYSQGGFMGLAMARHAPERVACLVIGGASASAASAYPTEVGKEDPLITALRGGPDALAKVWGVWLTSPLRERLHANDTDALLACRRQRLITEGFADVGRIATPALVYAGSADPIHDAAQQTASELPTAQFTSLPGLNHVDAMCRSDLVLAHVEPFLARAMGQ